MLRYWTKFLFLSTYLLFIINSNDVVFNADSKLGRRFDGIGAISGGGATSKLLTLYDDEDYDEIMSILFKKNYFASLHSIKVEIGGDSQSTEGSEASHMHNKNNENYFRGYQWDILEKAKEINPEIIVHSLPWALPGWISNPQEMATYISKWLTGAKNMHNISISTVGILNETPINSSYIEVLRNVLDHLGNKDVKIIAIDDGWQIIKVIEKNPSLKSMIHAIGVHYPRTSSPDDAKNIGLPLYASEDFSTFNDARGAACWARTLNRNYVNGLMTSTIAWNAVTSFFSGLPYFKTSLMNAHQPWSGYYEINGPIFVTAHHTHFYQPGWTYLAHGLGTGWLEKGGSYISAISPDEKDFTIVFETISYEDSMCFYDYEERKENIQDQRVKVKLDGHKLKNIRSLHIFETEFYSHSLHEPDYFKYIGEASIHNGELTINLKKNTLLTLSTVNTTLEFYNDRKKAMKPRYEKPFPLPYFDDFELKRKRAQTEPEYLTSQFGYFEVTSDPSYTYSQILQQMVHEKPHDWCTSSGPLALMGEAFKWLDIRVGCKIYMPKSSNASSIFIASRLSEGGCTTQQARGIFSWFDFKHQQIVVSQYLDKNIKGSVLGKINFPLNFEQWYDVSLTVKGYSAVVRVEDKVAIDIRNLFYHRTGFVALGSENFGPTYYKFLSIQRSD